MDQFRDTLGELSRRPLEGLVCKLKSCETVNHIKGKNMSEGPSEGTNLLAFKNIN